MITEYKSEWSRFFQTGEVDELLSQYEWVAKVLTAKVAYKSERKDEIFSAALEGVWQGILGYSPDRGVPPVPYLYRMAWHSIQYWRRETGWVSQYYQDKLGEDAPRFIITNKHHRTASPERSQVDQVADRDLCDELFGAISVRDKAVVLEIVRGSRFVDLGRELGLSRQRIHQIFKSSTERMKEFSELNGLA